MGTVELRVPKIAPGVYFPSMLEPRRRRASDYKRWERSRPMELWQMDVMGGVLLEDGTECKADHLDRR